MKKLLILFFIALFCAVLSAGYMFDGKIIFSKHAVNKDVYAYMIIEKAGGVLDTFGIIDTLGNITLIGDVTSTGSFTLDDSLWSVTSLWWYCKYMDGINMSPGGSGAVLTVPDDNTLGGYQLDVNTEYLYFNGAVCNNWDEASDMEVRICWELNAGGGGANDSVFFDLKSWYKGTTEDTTKYQTSTEGELVNNDGRYTKYSVTFTLDYDLVANVIQTGDILSFRLNLNTGASDVDNVVVNFANFRYKTKVPQPTTY